MFNICSLDTYILWTLFPTASAQSWSVLLVNYVFEIPALISEGMLTLSHYKKCQDNYIFLAVLLWLYHLES